MNVTVRKIFLPLLLVETYLLFTVWLFYFGPMIWPIENESKFLTLIVLYHVSFIAGYCIYAFRFMKKNPSVLTVQAEVFKSSNKAEDFVLKHYWVILALAFTGSIISHRNITHSSSYIPWNFFTDFYNGLVHPAHVRKYYSSAAYVADFAGNKYISASLLLISVFKYSLLPIFIFLKDRLSLVRKVVSCIVLAIPVVTGISLSLSVINFNYVFIISICCGIVMLTNGFKKTLDILRKRKAILLSFALLIFFAFWQFYFVKSEVSLYQVVVQKRTPLSFSYLTQKNVRFKSDEEFLKTGKNKTVIDDFYEKITAYLVQGYQGMSISLGEKFESSYGIGHSVFLQRVTDKHLDFNIGERTFQRKITKKWDENIYWHSAYSYFANDVGFYGVCAVMLLIGFYFSMVFTSAVVLGDFVAKLLLPLFGILFLYMPANNQVFGFLETMSSFWLLTAFFLVLNLEKES